MTALYLVIQALEAGALTCVNGIPVVAAASLRDGDCVAFGHKLIFRLHSGAGSAVTAYASWTAARRQWGEAEAGRAWSNEDSDLGDAIAAISKTVHPSHAQPADG